MIKDGVIQTNNPVEFADYSIDFFNGDYARLMGMLKIMPNLDPLFKEAVMEIVKIRRMENAEL
tara:strand:+ start:217 stop:405 length:189 start_codon:yes stop_codon:yes gene_type:complete